MTYREKYLTAKTWRKKIFVMGMYAKVMRYKGKDSSVRALAKYFSCSIGLVSENLYLFEPENYKKTRRCATRKHALILMGKK